MLPCLLAVIDCDCVLFVVYFVVLFILLMLSAVPVRVGDGRMQTRIGKTESEM